MSETGPVEGNRRKTWQEMLGVDDFAAGFAQSLWEKGQERFSHLSQQYTNARSNNPFSPEPLITLSAGMYSMTRDILGSIMEFLLAGRASPDEFNGMYMGIGGSLSRNIGTLVSDADIVVVMPGPIFECLETASPYKDFRYFLDFFKEGGERVRRVVQHSDVNHHPFSFISPSDVTTYHGWTPSYHAISALHDDGSQHQRRGGMAGNESMAGLARGYAALEQSKFEMLCELATSHGVPLASPEESSRNRFELMKLIAHHFQLVNLLRNISGNSSEAPQDLLYDPLCGEYKKSRWGSKAYTLVSDLEIIDHLIGNPPLLPSPLKERAYHAAVLLRSLDTDLALLGNEGPIGSQRARELGFPSHRSLADHVIELARTIQAYTTSTIDGITSRGTFLPDSKGGSFICPIPPDGGMTLRTRSFLYPLRESAQLGDTVLVIDSLHVPGKVRLNHLLEAAQDPAQFVRMVRTLHSSRSDNGTPMLAYLFPGVEASFDSPYLGDGGRTIGEFALDSLEYLDTAAQKVLGAESFIPPETMLVGALSTIYRNASLHLGLAGHEERGAALARQDLGALGLPDDIIARVEQTDADHNIIKRYLTEFPDPTWDIARRLMAEFGNDEIRITDGLIMHFCWENAHGIEGLNVEMQRKFSRHYNFIQEAFGAGVPAPDITRRHTTIGRMAGVDEAAAQSFCEQMGDEYILSLSNTTIAAHLKHAQAYTSPIIFKSTSTSDRQFMTLIEEGDRHGLLEQLLASLYLEGFDVDNANAFTGKFDGKTLVIDQFLVSHPDGVISDDLVARTNQRYHAISGASSVDAYFRENDEEMPRFPITNYSVKNYDELPYTVVVVKGKDQRGLALSLVHLLSQRGKNHSIEEASFTTYHGNSVSDTFLISYKGEKLSSAQIHGLERILEGKRER